MVSYGIDVSKAWVDSVRTDNSRRCKQQDRVDNDEAALHAYFSHERSIRPGMVVTVESTGMYHLAVVRACLACAVPVRVINPIMTKQLTRASVRKVKTDKKDALRIALLGLQRAGYLVTESQLAPARFYLRAGRKLAASISRLEASRRHYELAGLSQDILGGAYGAACIGLQTASAMLQKEGLRRCDAGTVALLESIPGFGPIVAGQVVAEVGDITRFKHAKQLVAYVGFDPKVVQSGSSIHRTGRISKRGSPHLRALLFIAASIARQHDPGLKAVYERKRAEGKTYKQAVVHVARLLIHRVYAVWKRGTPYEKHEEEQGTDEKRA